MYPVVLSPRGEKYLDIQMYCRYRHFLIFKNKWIFLNTAVHLNLRLRSWGYQLCIYVPSSTISARREVSRYSHVPQVRAFPYFLKINRPNIRFKRKNNACVLWNAYCPYAVSEIGGAAPATFEMSYAEKAILILYALFFRLNWMLWLG